MDGLYIYMNGALWDAGTDGVPSHAQSFTVIGGVHRLQYDLPEDRTYKEDSYALPCDCR